MLENIKYSFFKRNLFSMIVHKLKLQLVKYNKSFQKLINIDIIDYKLFSGRYIVYKTKTTGKEYNLYNCELTYEGEYKNGERNGKGKEYKEGNVIFEGEYRNGKRHGKGEELDYKGKTLFEGMYSNGKKWFGRRFDIDKIIYELKGGKGHMMEFHPEKMLIKDYTLYKPLLIQQGISYKYINLKYEGDYLNGERNGQGKEYYIYNIPKFQGEYKNGKQWKGTGFDLNHNVLYQIDDGKGYIYELNKYNQILYEGEYSNGERNGKGKEYINEELVFEGEYLNDKRNGLGIEYNNGLIKFEGEFLNGKRHGKGQEFDFIGKLKFDGQYEYGWRRRGKSYAFGKMEYEGEYLFERKWTGKGYNKYGEVIYEINKGKGTIRDYNYQDKTIYIGGYLNCEKSGKGKEIDFKGVLKFEGEYLKGKRNGKGIEYDSDGKVIFEGEYIKGERNGIGKEYYNNRAIAYEGEYLNGERNEKGKEYTSDGKYIFEGIFLNGKKWNGKGKEYNIKDESDFEYINGEKRK